MMAVTNIAPTTLPLIVGVNVALKVTLCPDSNVSGRLSPLT
jgi:hypothetical protein